MGGRPVRVAREHQAVAAAPLPRCAVRCNDKELKCGDEARLSHVTELPLPPRVHLPVSFYAWAKEIIAWMHAGAKGDGSGTRRTAAGSNIIARLHTFLDARFQSKGA